MFKKYFYIFIFFIIYFSAILGFVISVHQVKLNENEKCYWL